MAKAPKEVVLNKDKLVPKRDHQTGLYQIIDETDGKPISDMNFTHLKNVNDEIDRIKNGYKYD